MSEGSSEAIYKKGRCKELARYSRVRFTAPAFYKGVALCCRLAGPPISGS